MYSSFNILDMIDSIGEDSVKEILSDFSCPINDEITLFCRKNAIDFAKRKLSVTYLVFDEERRFVGYYTLTHKSSYINSDLLSKSNIKKLEMYAKKDDGTGLYCVSAFLIAQFGKNYSVDNGKGILGDDLMEFALNSVKAAQHLVGGGVVYLECEDKAKLLSFYQSDSNLFKLYGERISEKDGTVYKQLLRII